MNPDIQKLIEDYDEKTLALAKHLDCLPDDVSEETWGSFSAEGGEYLVLTEDEAEITWDEHLQSYLDDCVLPELPETAQCYFDEDAWKRDARMDGRGHTISSYDGIEHEVEINGEDYIIFRTS
jgi:hypothetical protein